MPMRDPSAQLDLAARRKALAGWVSAAALATGDDLERRGPGGIPETYVLGKHDLGGGASSVPAQGLLAAACVGLGWIGRRRTNKKEIQCPE
jgi:hypothetical protein